VPSPDVLALIAVALAAIAAVAGVALLLRRPPDPTAAIDELRRQQAELSRQQTDLARQQSEFSQQQAAAIRQLELALFDQLAKQGQQGRAELAASVAQFGTTLTQQMTSIAGVQNGQIDAFAAQLTKLTTANEQRLAALRETVQEDARLMREAVSEDARRTREAFTEDAVRNREAFAEDARRGREELAATLRAFGEAQSHRLGEMSAGNEAKLGEVRATLETKLRELQADNAGKLEEMRRTVDEKLHATLEQRLGESFKLVSDRLEQVHRGLGEMQALASDVGDLKRVLSNVKTRGTWGEVQLASLLEQMLVPDQYAANVSTVPGSNERVEFAIRLPGQGADAQVWLPIDAKFPREDYERLQIAHEQADAPAAEAAAKQLETRLKLEAKTIREKYVAPPHTTDFALMFLPVEGLFAEAVRRPGLVDELQRQHRVVVAGPTTLAAILSSLQMGFRTLAVEKRSSEVWQLLRAVKTEFGKFGEMMARAREQVDRASRTLGDYETRSRAIERRLRGVESLPEPESRRLLGEAAVDVPGAVGEPGEDEGPPASA
jgi:DNA recombination protein RmuC